MAASRVITLVSLLVVSKGSATDTIVRSARATPTFSVLVEAIVKAGLATTLSGTGPFTVFAPTNAAFTALLDNSGINKTELLDRSDLADILKDHVLSGNITSGDLQPSQTPTTLQGSTVEVLKGAVGVTYGTRDGVAGAKVTEADIVCTNGVIHTIDKVMLPPGTTISSSHSGTTPSPAVAAESNLAASKSAVA